MTIGIRNGTKKLAGILWIMSDCPQDLKSTFLSQKGPTSPTFWCWCPNTMVRVLTVPFKGY